MDSRSYLGSVMFSTGPNVEFGGTNATACHMDIPMRNCSLYLDDEQIIDAGRVLPAALKPTSPAN
jgi:2,5-dihydroxypyridine 5,6-dioxygenase